MFVAGDRSEFDAATSPVSRPAWVGAMNALTGTGGENRKSPVEIFADAASVVTRSHYAEVTGIKHGKLGRWTDGVAELRAARTEFAAYWDAHNDRVLTNRDATPAGRGPRPAVGRPRRLDRAGPRRGGPARRLRRPDPVPAAAHDRQALAGAQPLRIRRADARRARRPDTAAGRPAPDLVTCGAGANDILYSAPGKLFGDLRTLLAAVPEDTVMLDLPLLSGFWGIVGRMSVPYITRINRVIHEVATERRLRVAEVSRHFIPPWAGKFSVDNFHPSQDGYRDWSRALVEALPMLATAQQQQPPR